MPSRLPHPHLPSPISHLPGCTQTAAELAAEYPPHLQHLAPTPADLDDALEQAHGKPVDKGTAAANVAALRQRVAEMTALKLKLDAPVRTPGGASVPASLSPMLAEVDADLQRARELLAGYELQLRQAN